jgi:hypothetical protein
MEFSLHNYIVFEVANLLNATKLVIKSQKAASTDVEKPLINAQSIMHNAQF